MKYIKQKKEYLRSFVFLYDTIVQIRHGSYEDENYDFMSEIINEEMYLYQSSWEVYQRGWRPTKSICSHLFGSNMKNMSLDDMIVVLDKYFDWKDDSQPIQEERIDWAKLKKRTKNRPIPQIFPKMVANMFAVPAKSSVQIPIDLQSTTEFPSL